jgi:hypothetical protein
MSNTPIKLSKEYLRRLAKESGGIPSRYGDAFGYSMSTIALQRFAEAITSNKADAQRYYWLSNYLPSDYTHLDDAIVACKTPEELSALIDNEILDISGLS